MQWIEDNVSFVIPVPLNGGTGWRGFHFNPQKEVWEPTGRHETAEEAVEVLAAIRVELERRGILEAA